MSHILYDAWPGGDAVAVARVHRHTFIRTFMHHPAKLATLVILSGCSCSEIFTCCFFRTYSGKRADDVLILHITMEGVVGI